MDRLRELDPKHLLYERTQPGGTGPLHLTPLELLGRLAALVPPPRVHRHRYFGVLAPNAPLRTAVTALAPVAAPAPPPAAEPAPRLEPLHGGLSNRAFVVDDGSERYVARCGGDIPVHHVFRDRERAASVAAPLAQLR